jgi:hypothetical protein
MTKRDSYLVKQIKKLERHADRANSDLSEYFFYKSPEGQAAESIDQIHEIVHEALIMFDEAKLQEKQEAEREALEKKKRKNTKPKFQGIESCITTGVKPKPKIWDNVKKLFSS